jgi:hypothetical protein
VIAVNLYGELILSVTWNDFEKKLFIFDNTTFTLATNPEDPQKRFEHQVTFCGFPFTGVEEGAWICGPLITGHVKVAIRPGSSATHISDLHLKAGVKAGDKIFVKEKEPEKPKAKSSGFKERMAMLERGLGKK